MSKYFDRGLARVFAAGALMVTLLFGAGQTLRADDAKEKPLMKDFMGINAHLNFKPELYQPICSLIRNYHPVTWDNNGDSSYLPKFPLTREDIDNGPLDWVKHFNAWKAHGFTIDDCLQVESVKSGWKDIDKDCEAYGEAYAKHLGPSSTNAVTSAEIGNEPADIDDKTYRKIFESMAKGLRAGDPKLKIVTAAAAAGKPDKYSKSVADVAGLEDLYDVLNVHTYSMITGWPTWRRVHPEHANIDYLKVITEMINWRNGHAPGKEIWVTEFGYDAKSANQAKPSGDFAGWVSSTETEQAQWLVRSFLIFSSMDVDRAYLYYYDDNDEPIFHGSSGITRKWQPKPSYYALAHLQKTLGDYRFSKVIVKKEPTKADEAKADAPKKDNAAKDDDAAATDDSAAKSSSTDGPLYVYEYVNPDKPSEPIWVAWLPTGSQAEGTRSIPITGKVLKAERMPLKEGDAEAVDFKDDGSNVELTVTESPTYIWLKQ